MPKYLITANYSREGTAGLIADGGSSRRAVIEASAASLGGSVECLYFMFGEDDAIAIVDLPDNESAAAIGLTVAASGGASFRTTVLLTAEQVDAAAKKSPSYRAPGS